MNLRIVCLLGGLAAGAFGLGRLTAQKDPAAVLRTAVMNADKAFDKDTVTGGAKAWAGWFAPDGRMLGSNGKITQGRADIEALMSPFLSAKGTSLRWQPTFAEVARSGELGYTIGESTTRTLNEKGQTMESRGRYVTLWRKQANGDWRIALDTGQSTSAKLVTTK